MKPRTVKILSFWFLSIFLLIYIYMIYDLISSQLPLRLILPEQYSNPAPQPKTYRWEPSEESASSKFPNVTILMWTTYYGNKDLMDHIGKDSPVPHWCRVTFDRNQLYESGALVFSMMPNDYNPVDLPPRIQNQIWVFFVIEPPAYHTFHKLQIDGLFNRTLTFRLDSDYPSPYGYVTKQYPALIENPYYTDPTFPRNKTKLIAWMVSHCESSNNRQKVYELLEDAGLEIDVYGKCGALICDQKKEMGCYRQLGQTYKFYLAFENSNCHDYITEKFSNALYSNLVPIVYGGGSYQSILPSYPKPAFINVRDFKSVKELAQYLLYLDGNETAYGEYFEWKQYYQVKVKQGFSGFKKICYDLVKRKDGRGMESSRTYNDLHNWWNQQGKCQNGWPSNWW